MPPSAANAPGLAAKSAGFLSKFSGSFLGKFRVLTKETLSVVQETAFFRGRWHQDAVAGMLRDLAVNAPQLDGVTDTDLAEIGLPMAKTPQRATNPPGICPDLRSRHGEMPGQVLATCKPPEGNIRTYEAQMTLDPKGDT